MTMGIRNFVTVIFALAVLVSGELTVALAGDGANKDSFVFTAPISGKITYLRGIGSECPVPPDGIGADAGWMRVLNLHYLGKIKSDPTFMSLTAAIPAKAAKKDESCPKSGKIAGAFDQTQTLATISSPILTVQLDEN